MEPDEYRRMAAVEATMWWYRGLHANVTAELRPLFARRAAPRVLDAGCGTGGLLVRLADAAPEARLFGIDYAEAAIAAARAKAPRASLVVGSVTAPPFPAGAFDVVVSCDVLSHAAVEPVAALRALADVTAPGGALVLNLPAFPWMLSQHDRRVANARRFTRAGVRRLIGEAGLRLARLRFWNCALFPLMVLRRLTTGYSAASDVRLYPAPLERAFRAVMAAEGAWLARGGGFPFGGSLLAAAIKD